MDSSGDFWVVDGDPDLPPFRALVHVDATTGARTIVSGCGDAACNTTIGTGPLFSGRTVGLEIESDTKILLSDGDQRSVFRVDTNTGNRSVVSGCADPSCASIVGAGTDYTTPLGIVMPLPEPGAGLALGAGTLLLTALQRRRRRSP
jgi:hypothetical protein